MCFSWNPIGHESFLVIRLVHFGLYVTFISKVPALLASEYLHFRRVRNLIFYYDFLW